MPRKLIVDRSDAKHIAIDLFNLLMMSGLIDQGGNSMGQVTRAITDYFSRPIQLNPETFTTVVEESERVWFHNMCGGMLVQMGEETWVCDKCGVKVGNPDIVG